MMRIRMIPALLAILALPIAGEAMVDMKNSNYGDSWLDISLTGAGYSLKVERYYNSRSLFSGMFGFGWCSDFETNIENPRWGKFVISTCVFLSNNLNFAFLHAEVPPASLQASRSATWSTNVMA